MVRQIVRASLLAAVAFLGVRAGVAEEVGWEYEFSSSDLGSAAIPQWQKILKDGGASSLTPEGLRLESSSESTAFYQISSSLWSGGDGEATFEFEVAVEEVAEGARFGAQFVVSDGEFIYLVNLPQAPMSQYRLVTDNGEASLYLDGKLRETAASNPHTPDPDALLVCRPASGAPKLYFGDGSATVGGVSVWRLFRFGHGKVPASNPSAKITQKPSARKLLTLAPPDLTIDPRTRSLQVRYQMPEEVPEEARVSCAWRTNGGEWTPASVLPFMSATGLALASSADKAGWKKGEIREQNAAGQTREITWMPYDQIAPSGDVDVELRLQVSDSRQEVFGEVSGPVKFRNADVEAITTFSAAAQKADASYQIESVKTLDGSKREAVVYPASSEEATTPLKIAPAAMGKYAIFLGGDSMCWVKVGDKPFERAPPRGALPKSEIFLGVHDFQGDSLQFLPRPTGIGTSGLWLSSVRFVPVQGEELVPAAGSDSKILAGYFEPYSWAFWRLVSRPEDFREAIGVYRDYGFDLVDTQLGRFGSRLLYESEVAAADRFTAKVTTGDQGAQGIPSKSTKVWSMLEKTSPLRDLLRAAAAEKVKLSANFGATICYPGTANESEFAKTHPTLRRDNGNFLIFSEPKVQEYMLSIYREVLDLGAPSISLDFCRYPHGIDRAEDVTVFLRKLRALADGYPEKRSILVRFPATGESKAECFDYRTWTKEKLVDYIFPGNIKMAVLNFDVAPYVEAAKGTGCKVLPTIDLLPGPFETSGPLLRRASEIYRAGADGIYVYQPDAFIFYADSLRDFLPLLKDPVALEQVLSDQKESEKLATKNIFLHPPVVAHFAGYRATNDRIRFWLEGDIGPEAELWADGKKLASFSGYPYTIGDEAMNATALLPDGTQKIQIRAKDGAKWFERSFTVTIVPNPS